MTSWLISIPMLATVQLNKKISPANASNAMVVWSSKDTNIATVNSDGVVTAVSTGTTVITATSTNGGFTAQATVEVNRGITSYSTRLTGIEHHEYS